jgi:hypothetical protein
MRLTKFVDVLEAMLKKSWKNKLSSEEKPVVDKLFDRILRIKESEGQTMAGTEIVAETPHPTNYVQSPPDVVIFGS